MSFRNPIVKSWPIFLQKSYFQRSLEADQEHKCAKMGRRDWRLIQNSAWLNHYNLNCKPVVFIWCFTHKGLFFESLPVSLHISRIPWFFQGKSLALARLQVGGDSTRLIASGKLKSQGRNNEERDKHVSRRKWKEAFMWGGQPVIRVGKSCAVLWGA